MPASDTTTPLAASEASAGTEIDFAALSRRVETGLWVYDFDAGRIIWANGPGLDIWNAATLTELSQRDLLSDMSVSVKRRLAQYLQDFITKDAVFSEFWTVYPGGIPALCRFDSVACA